MGATVIITIIAIVILITIGILGILIIYGVIKNPLDSINEVINAPDTNMLTDTAKLSNADLIKNIKKNALTDELAQSYLDGGEINLEALSNDTLQKLYFMKGVELRYMFGIVPVILDVDFKFVIDSYNKDTKTFGGTPITDTNAQGFTEYVVIRDKVDKLKRLWKTTTSSPYPDNDQVFYNNIIALN